MIIRLAKTSDMQAIHDFQDREASGRPDGAFFSDFMWRSAIEDNEILGVYDGQQSMMGFLRFILTEDNFNILYVHVASDKRGQKIGKKLFESALALADISGVPTKLSVNPQNIKAKNLYEKFGFIALAPEYQDSDMRGLSESMSRKPFIHLKM